ncbi:Dihydrolipoamide succinyltransferase component (E2) of 2-oxoglutarate dehydrogenase complex [Fulvivirga imtechensis AK7]|uniref:Dihydrolipoyllysine-residue succinyltransferase component of 2-oxoglutarate dehydrogenase complex n=1 Tax=Fulvivirga imtechensis AK7 TaxID=1237149 RepID=L8JVW2_9BACT|nr:2-oxoglutarate dehydrogenase complex dihydrolipoyllysine-residue succinyltransferase [Fulvivirga imtechensis]ELR71367.1 Dihydrolipoamide succinyltransferase component (E2) of 2-oxoglutarate dehydrogenase complex [Fulvivirga imtechensis AK7]
MSLEIKIPEVGESITEVVIGAWLKGDGDYVEQDEIIAEIETDKATQEFPAEASGILKIKVQEGETVEVGSVIAEIDTDAKSSGNGAASKEETPSAKPVKEEQSASTAKKTGEIKEMHVSELGESITEVTLASWFKQDGDFVELDETIAEIESDKATFELPAEANGILRTVAKEGDTLEIGALLCKIEVMEGKPAEKATAKASSAEPVKAGGDDQTSYAAGHPSPAAAKILDEKGISSQDVKGTGVGGRVTKEDAERAQKAEQSAKTQPSAQPEASPAVYGERNERREKMSNLRKTISRRLVSVKNETAMLTTFNEVDMKPIMDLRKKYKDQFKEKYGVGLGFMSFFTKACCQALKEWPAVNASIDGEELVYHDYCDISIAVSTPRGLVVPVIRNAENMNFQGIESEIIRLAGKARDGKLSIEEMSGGTFTITNGGVFGSMLSTPIINAPQSAILGMHNIVERPVAINGQVEIRPIMYVALSYDHRIIDGRESVSFLVRVKELLEDPTRLMLGV